MDKDKSIPPLDVLVAEDHEINQELMQEMLQRLHCKVDTAKNGREAVEHASTKAYDMIFMDIHMPEMDGYEAAKEIRKHRVGGKQTRIIALTANVLQGTKSKCLEAGMDDYISKPIELKDIEAVLIKYFG